MSAALGIWPIVGLLGYLTILIGVCVSSARRSIPGDKTDYFVAGRSQGWLITSLTIMATFFSAFAMLGGPGLVYREGVAFALFGLNIPFAGVCVYVFGNRIRMLGIESGAVTPYEGIESHYGNSPLLRVLVTITCLLYAIPYIVLQFQAGGVITAAIFGTQAFLPGTVGIAVLTTAYVCFGGMRSVSLTDGIQGAVLIIGMFLLGIGVVAVTGGWSAFLSQAQQDLPESSLTLPGTTGSWGWPMLLTICCFATTASMISPPQWMRFYAARGGRELRRAGMLSAVILSTCFLSGVVFVGLAGQMLYPLQFSRQVDIAWEGDPEGAFAGLEPAILEQLSIQKRSDSSSNQIRIQRQWDSNDRLDPELVSATEDSAWSHADTAIGSLFCEGPLSVRPHEKLAGDFNAILPVIVLDTFPTIFGVLGQALAAFFLVGVLAAAMSTADSNLHSMSAVFSRDVYGVLMRKDCRETERLMAGKMFVVALAAVALVLTLASHYQTNDTLFDFARMIALLGLTALVFMAQLLPITIDVLFLKRGTLAGAIWGLASGLVISVIFSPLMPVFSASMSPDSLFVKVSDFVAGMKTVPVHGSVWGLAVNVALFCAVSRFSRPRSA